MEDDRQTLEMILVTMEEIKRRLDDIESTPSEKPLNTKEAAKELGLEPQTMALWRSQGIGPDYIKVGKCVRYSREGLQDYKKRQTVTN